MSDNLLFRIPNRLYDEAAKEEARLRIAVVGASSGAGASYVSSVILRKGPFSGIAPDGLRSLAELGTPYFYMALGMDKRFAGRDFYYYEDSGPLRLNMELGYNWYLRAPESGPASAASMFRAAYTAPGGMVVFDFSGLQTSEQLLPLLAVMDVIYLVIDPLPTRLIPAQDVIDRIRVHYPEAELVVNKFNRGIHRGELSRFLGTSDFFTVDAVSCEALCRAEYNCSLVKLG